MASGKITIEIDPELREAIDSLLPAVQAAQAFTDCVDAHDGQRGDAFCRDEYADLEAAVQRRKRYVRATKPIKVVK
jgi:hypothetical protein